MQVPTDRLDEMVSTFERELIPRYRDQSGYKGFTMLINRRSGKAVGVSFWESEDARAGSEELGAEARAAMREAAGGQARIIREDWEVALDDMV
jgi:hypothetical protein